LLHRKRPSSMQGIFGRDSRLVSPPNAIRGSGSRSIDTHDRRPMDKVLVTEGVHRDLKVDDELNKLPHDLNRVHVSPPEINVGAHANHRPNETEAVYKQRVEANAHRPSHLGEDPDAHRQTSLSPDAAERNFDRSQTFPADDHAKGHAHDPLSDTLFLDIGVNSEEPHPEHRDDGSGQHVVSESPPEVEMNIYEQAYQDEIKRILDRRGKSASMYLTRRVEHREDFRSHGNIMSGASDVASKLAGLASKTSAGLSSGGGGIADLVRKAKEQQAQDGGEKSKQSSEESEDPPLQAPKFDGADDAPTTNGNGIIGIPESIIKAQAEVQAHLDVAKGAMPGMPGAFPVSPARSEMEESAA
jgi:calcium/calmodulin-dependent protein kinase kinase 2